MPRPLDTRRRFRAAPRARSGGSYVASGAAAAADAHVLHASARHPHQVEVDGHEVLADDEQPRRRQQVVDVRDPAGDRVLDRDHRQLGQTGVDGLEGVLEGGARQGGEFGVHLAARGVRVRPRLALVGDPTPVGRQVVERAARAGPVGSGGGVGHGVAG